MKKIKSPKIVKSMIFFKIALCVMSLTTSLSAEIPYIFSENTTAKAKEVNANFSSLDQRILLLENITNNGQQNTSSNQDCDKSVFEYNYNYIQSNIGDIILIGNQKYIIIGMPFEEFGTKEHYYIKYPEALTQDNNTNYYRTKQTFNFIKKGDSCYPDKFDNFPSKNSIIYERTYAHINETNEFTVHESVFAIIQVKINQTVFHFFSYLNEVESQKISLTDKDVDFKDNIDWSKLSINNQLIENQKKLLNYIDIVKIGN